VSGRCRPFVESTLTTPSTALVAPAVAHAVFAATIERVTSLTLAKHGLV
jgi:hypothetical protein